MRGNTAPLIFSAEFGALFSHHWNGFYKEMEIERPQRPILHHVSADSHSPKLSRASTSQYGRSGCLSQATPCHMRLRQLRFVVPQIKMQESLVKYRRNNDDGGTAPYTIVAPLALRPVLRPSLLRTLAASLVASHTKTADASRTPTESHAHTCHFHHGSVPNVLRLPKDCFRDSASICVPVAQAFAESWLRYGILALYRETVKQLNTNFAR